MSAGSASVVVPEAVARQRHINQTIIGGVIKMQRSIAADIYGKIVASEYHLRTMVALEAAKKEADPFGTRDSDDVAKEIQAVPVAVDINTIAKLSLQAADCLLYHLDLIDAKGNIKLGDEPAAPADGQNRSEGGILLG